MTAFDRSLDIAFVDGHRQRLGSVITPVRSGCRGRFDGIHDQVRRNLVTLIFLNGGILFRTVVVGKPVLALERTPLDTAGVEQEQRTDTIRMHPCRDAARHAVGDFRQVGNFRIVHGRTGHGCVVIGEFEIGTRKVDRNAGVFLRIGRVAFRVVLRLRSDDVNFARCECIILSGRYLVNIGSHHVIRQKRGQVRAWQRIHIRSLCECQSADVDLTVRIVRNDDILVGVHHRAAVGAAVIEQLGKNDAVHIARIVYREVLHVDAYRGTLAVLRHTRRTEIFLAVLLAADLDSVTADIEVECRGTGGIQRFRHGLPVTLRGYGYGELRIVRNLVLRSRSNSLNFQVDLP